MPEKKASAKKDDRVRSWTFVLYPDSAPENWRELLDELHVQWCESPLHDLDVNPTGEVKKAHYHVALTFEGKKSYEQILEMIEPLNATIPQRVHDLRGLVRYFVHLDNPEKHQYDIADIRGHGGFDVTEALRPSATMRYQLVREMMLYCRENGVIEFQDLCDYAMSDRYEDWFPLLCDSCCVIMQNYIKSQRHRSEGSPRGEASAARGDTART